MWIDETTAMIGRGHRTNDAAISQIAITLSEIGCELIVVDMPYGTMHFMGMLRILDRDLAICWPRRTPHATVRILQERGYQVHFPPFGDDQASYRGMNFVTLGPRQILMVSGLPIAQSFFENLGIECHLSTTDELSKAAGNVAVLQACYQEIWGIPGTENIGRHPYNRLILCAPGSFARVAQLAGVKDTYPF